MNEENRSTGQVSNNQNIVMDSSFMIFRTDTQALIRDIKNFLASKETKFVKDENGNWCEVDVPIGLAIANEEGIMKICNMVRMNINQHTAQASIDVDHYWSLIERTRKEITDTIITKCYDWEIHDSDLKHIIDSIMRLIELFFTRPIDNKERDAYSQVQKVQSTEITNAGSPGILSRFSIGRSRA